MKEVSPLDCFLRVMVALALFVIAGTQTLFCIQQCNQMRALQEIAAQTEGLNTKLDSIHEDNRELLEHLAGVTKRGKK